MYQDKYGQLIYTEQDICNIVLTQPTAPLHGFLTSDLINFDSDLELEHVPEINHYQPSDVTLEEFDAANQKNWHMPAEYSELDIAKWLLDQCKTDAERQRVGEELLLYLERNLFTLLQYLKYLVDTMRTHNIVWGVGRGSSVSSYVLYLIGIHKINSMYFDLDIHEFLR